MANDSKFREDTDLAFLKHADYQDLALLARYLIEDSEGKEQWTGQLKQTIRDNISQYGSEQEAYKNSWMAIAAELQLYGGDTLVNLFRRKGVPYKEILKDVANRVEADFHKDIATTEQIEEKILRKLFNRITTLQDLELINNTLKEKGYLGLSSIKDKPLETLFNGTSTAGKVGGLLKVFAPLNPIGSALIAKDITAPAYRVTIPAVCIIAMMRIKHNAEPNKASFF